MAAPVTSVSHDDIDPSSIQVPQGAAAQQSISHADIDPSSITPPQEGSTLDKIKETGKRWLKGTAEILPAAGGVMGGIGGAIAGAAGGTVALPGLGTAAGAAELGTLGAGAGAATGTALKQLIEQNILGEGKKTVGQNVNEMANQTALNMGGQAIGGTLVKGAKAVAPAVGSTLTGVSPEVIQAYLNDQMGVSQVLSQAGGKVAVAAQALQQKILDKVTGTQADLEKPALKVIADNVTADSNAEAGSFMKKAIMKRISDEHGPLLQGYSHLDNIQSSIPYADEDRLALTQGFKKYVLQEMPQSGSTYQTVKKISDTIDASANGKMLQTAEGEAQAALTQAYKEGNSPAIQALTRVSDYLDKFKTDRVKEIAQRFAAGTATPEESQAFEGIAKSQGIPEGEDLTKYAKQIANDFLKGNEQLDTKYSGFKDMLNFVQQQAGVRKSAGAGTLLKNLAAIPDEKLVDKMFTPDNVKALTRLKGEMPDVFEKLAQTQVRDLVQSASTDKGLDTLKFISSVNELPKEVRGLIFDPEELQALTSVENNPRLLRLNEVYEGAHSSLTKVGADEGALLDAGRGHDKGATRDLVELSRLTGSNLIGEAQKLAAAKDLGKASGQEALRHIGKNAAAGAFGGEIAHAAGVPVIGPAVGAAAGAVKGAATSPYILKQGLGALNSPAAPTILGQGIVRAGQGLNNMLGDNLKPPEGQ